MKPMNSFEFVNMGIKICEDRKIQNLQVYDVSRNSVLTDFCMFGSGNSTAHIRAISQHLGKNFKDAGVLPRNIEGTPASKWILMDYGYVLIHLFLEETREYYRIEDNLDKTYRIYSQDRNPAPAASV